MTITTLSSREFNQDASGAKKAAKKGPVFITDRGRPAHVLLTIEEYQRLTGSHNSIIDMLAMPGVENVMFEPPRLSDNFHRAGRSIVMYLLDTNVISELRKAKSGKADANVMTWGASVLPATLFLSVITILELELGVLLVERGDKKQGSMLRTWLDSHVLPAFSGRILPIDTTVAQRCAKLHVPNPRADRDALIAATALAHGMTVVTRNVADFQPMGVALHNPWN